MQFRVEDASFEGVPLTGLRCLPAEFFSDYQYLNEADTSIHPTNVFGRGVSNGRPRSEGRTGLEAPDYTEKVVLGNETLPVFNYRTEIVNAVINNPFTIITAETGAGKSTQVPQILLGANFEKVYLTQPRRAAARNVFERIRDELSATLGEGAGDELVSYQTAGERDGPEDARIKVTTDGLQMVLELHDSGGQEHEVVIIDEAHEDNSNQEVLMAWLKSQVAEKPNRHIVIMSATMDAERRAAYLADVCPRTPPIIEIPGRLHRVESSERPESTVVQEVLKAAEAIHNDPSMARKDSNGILVFEPGKREINDTIDEIRRRLPAHIAKTATILPLHAKQSVSEQQAAFRTYPGIKIVVATEVAQTSLTIPDIKYVIDSGYQRRMELDHEGVQGLVLHPVSQAECDQRAGRAGRVSDGVYVLTRMDAKTPHVPYISRDKFPMAEILRTDIVRNTLRIAGVDLDMTELDLYHSVDHSLIRRAQGTLRTLGALDDDNLITTTGKRMNQFPVCASSARMMVEAERFSEQTRAYMAAIVASKEVGGLQYFAYNVGKRWKDLTDEKSSDLLAQLDLFIAIQGMKPADMKDYDLDLNNIERAREQYQKIARRVNAFQETLLPPTAEEREDIKNCIYAGMVTSIYKHTGSGTYLRVGNTDTPRQISNRSLVQGSPPVVVGDAYRVQYRNGEETIVKHIIEHATGATLADLGRVAVHLSKWKSDGYAMRAGKFVDVRRLSLFDIDLGVTEEVVAEPSLKLREMVINHAVENAGTYQNKLRAIKKQLEEFAHLAKDHVEQLTHDRILALVDQAAPADITDPSVIDNNLRILMEQQDISLESFVSAERQARIIADAPRIIEAEGFKFPVAYKKSRPLIRKYDPEIIAKLKDEIFLPDGRQVYFVHERKRCTLVELQEKLGVA